MLHTPSGFLALSFVQFGTLLLNGQRRFALYRLASVLWSVIGKPKTSARGCLGEVCDIRRSVVSQRPFDKPTGKKERPVLPASLLTRVGLERAVLRRLAPVALTGGAAQPAANVEPPADTRSRKPTT